MRTLIIILLLLISGLARASHIVGGEIYYNYLGSNNYEVHIIIYRDCASSGAAFDSPLPLGIYNASNQLVQAVDVPFPGSVVLPITFNNPCINPPTGICTEKAEYITTVNLPPIPGGYVLSYQRCCRGPNVVNLSNPADEGLTLTVNIPTSASSFHVNNSARFDNYPPLVICNNDDLIFDHGATDPDGDSLVYSLVTPNNGLTSFQPAITPGPSLNYGPVVWDNGFSGTNPLGAGSNLQINPQTGLLTGTPQLTGLFVVGIRVQEFRNGVLINSTIRDFLFRIITCNITLQALIPDQEDLPSFISYCEGLSIQFENNSYGGSTYLWDFGVPGTNTDQSTAFEPSFTFPQSGTYDITLIVNPGSPCTDTVVKPYIIYEELDVDFTYTDSLCFEGNSVDFSGTLNGNPATQFTWDFGSDAIPQTATTQNVNGVHFTTAGTFPVKLVGTYNVCSDSVTYDVHILPKPIADFDMSPDYECDGLTQTFTNSTQFAQNYFWDFGVPGILSDTSNANSPVYTYTTPGVYDVTLIAHANGGCSDTTVKSLEFFEPLIISITHNDSLCITGNSFDFDASVSGPPNTSWSWDFGPLSSVPTSTQLSVHDVSFSQPGVIPISFSATFNDCIETINDQVFLFKEPAIHFGMIDGLQCAPFTAQFIDSSSSDTPLYYQWDFGDGSTSTDQDPVHIFDVPGVYPITLSVRTDDGCVDTLHLTRNDLVDVKPTPVSKFSVSPEETDICNSVVFFSNESTDATLYRYFFDDVNSFSDKENTAHTYFTDGSHYPRLIARNEYGCADTSMQHVYIAPYTVFIPNAFTPDQDEHNNTFDAEVALEPVEWEFYVYDRWGQVLFESKDPNVGWDGTYQGKLMPTGVYTWKIRYISCAAGARWEEQTGHFSLLR